MATRVRGRPRNEQIDSLVLSTALRLLAEVGFRALTMDAIAEVAEVGKMSLYRRWPNKAAVVMDAFLTIVGPGSAFPKADSPLHSVKLQMRLQARLFSGDYGRLIKSLLGEAQFDAELATAFRERWLQPRRLMTRSILARSVNAGELNDSADFDLITDLLYGPLYYRLQLDLGGLNSKFTDSVFESVMAAFRTT
jgi:AcrR family transcriptional regulator